MSTEDAILCMSVWTIFCIAVLLIVVCARLFAMIWRGAQAAELLTPGSQYFDRPPKHVRWARELPAREPDEGQRREQIEARAQRLQRATRIDWILVGLGPCLFGLAMAAAPGIVWNEYGARVSPTFFSTIAGALPLFSALLFAAVAVPWQRWMPEEVSRPQGRLGENNALVDRFEAAYPGAVSRSQIFRLISDDPKLFRERLEYGESHGPEWRAENPDAYRAEQVKFQRRAEEAARAASARAAKWPRLVVADVFVWNLIGLFLALMLVAVESTSATWAAFLGGVFCTQLLSLGLVIVIQTMDRSHLDAQMIENLLPRSGPLGHRDAHMSASAD